LYMPLYIINTMLKIISERPRRARGVGSWTCDFAYATFHHEISQVPLGSYSRTDGAEVV